MTYAIVDSSPKALDKVETFEDAFGVEEELSHQRSIYPWSMLAIGKSFAVPFAEANEASIRNGAVTHAKRTGKKFTIIRHNAHNCFEIARIK